MEADRGVTTMSLVGKTLAEVERQLILETLEHCRGNRTHTAVMLGVSLRTVRNKVKEYASNGAPAPAARPPLPPRQPPWIRG